MEPSQIFCTAYFFIVLISFAFITCVALTWFCCIICQERKDPELQPMVKPEINIVFLKHFLFVGKNVHVDTLSISIYKKKQVSAPKKNLFLCRIKQQSVISIMSLISLITLEPVTFLFTFGQSILGGAQVDTDLLLNKICVTELSHNIETCSNFTFIEDVNTEVQR